MRQQDNQSDAEAFDFTTLENFMTTCNELYLVEFAPMLRGIISLYADAHGISVGKVLDAMILEKNYDGDPYIEKEQGRKRITS